LLVVTSRGEWVDDRLELPWTKLVAPPLTDELIERVVDGTRAQLGERTIRQPERYRDDCIVNVLAAVRNAKADHGLCPEE
jgi:carnitine 3-dehydrogenase